MLEERTGYYARGKTPALACRYCGARLSSPHWLERHYVRYHDGGTPAALDDLAPENAPAPFIRSAPSRGGAGASPEGEHDG